jgi:hypothetical protein
MRVFDTGLGGRRRGRLGDEGGGETRAVGRRGRLGDEGDRKTRAIGRRGRLEDEGSWAMRVVNKRGSLTFKFFEAKKVDGTKKAL